MSEAQDKEFVEQTNSQLMVRLLKFKKQHFDLQKQTWKVLEVNPSNSEIVEPSNVEHSLESVLSNEQLEKQIAANRKFIDEHLSNVTEQDILQRRLTMTDACQLNVRRIKSQIQFNEEFYLAKHGSGDQKIRFTPLVMRRLFKSELENNFKNHSVPNIFQQLVTYGVQTVLDSENGIFHDGDQFTFLEKQEVEITYKECLCETDIGVAGAGLPPSPPLHNIEQIQNGLCPNVHEWKQTETVPQLKHNIGSWNCNGCVLSSGRGTGAVRKALGENSMPPSSEINSTFIKATKWCPNFLAAGVGPQLAQHGVEKYREVMTNSTDQSKLCYAGIMHIQITPVDGGVAINYKCDTCGLSIGEMLPVVEEPTEVTEESKAL